MENVILFQKIILSFAIGILVGLEREKRIGKETFAGIRTFPLVCLFGVLTAYLSFLTQNFIPIYLGLFSVCCLASLSYYFKYKRFKRVGLTTAIAFLLTFLIGVILFFENFPYFISISLGILLTLLLVSKESMHRFVKHLTKKEIMDAVIFGVVAFVILPLLPNKPIDPLKIINPYRIWFAIVLVLLISFSAYVAMRIFGEKGLILSALFAGLVSSTSLTANIAGKFRKRKEMSYALFLIALASSTAFLRQLFIFSLFNFQLFYFLFTPFFIFFVIGILISRISWKKVKKKTIEIPSPLSFKQAFQFSLFFTFVLIITKIFQIYFGSKGVFVISFFAGLPNVDAIAITLANLSKNNLPLVYASTGILLASFSNNLFKWLLTLFLGNKKLFSNSTKIFIPLILTQLTALIIFSKIFLFS